MSNLKYTNLPAETSSEDVLVQLALDLSRPWRHSASPLWRLLNPELWELTHSAWVVLQTVSGDRLEKVTSDPVFQKALQERIEARRKESELPRWFPQAHPDSPLKTV